MCLPLPNLDKVAIQPRGICVRANLLQALDYIGIICLVLLLLFSSPWCRTSSLRQTRRRSALLLWCCGGLRSATFSNRSIHGGGGW